MSTERRGDLGYVKGGLEFGRVNTNHMWGHVNESLEFDQVSSGVTEQLGECGLGKQVPNQHTNTNETRYRDHED